MLKNKNIVLTGASSGIGLEVLKLLCAEPTNRILAVSRHAEEKLGFVGENVYVYNADVSSREGVDKIVEKENEVNGRKTIDIFYANAGFPYYEEYNYTNWERILKIFETNTISPIYTYGKYLHHLDGREGHLAYTVSAIGQMAVPGYALYSATKFALNGFQQAMRYEKPNNMRLTCLYPIATNTNFFKVANPVEFEKPFPVQQPGPVARKMVSALETGKKYVFPSTLYTFSRVLMGVCPPVRTVYLSLENNKLERFKKKLKELGKN